MADKVFRSGAPEIERVFESRNKRNPGKYCAVCLRSDTERRLVDNGTFKKFILAVNLEHNWKPLQEPKICYMCDRQAVNALKFYRATHFASSINKIFMEIMMRDKSVRKHSFHKTHFKKMLMQMNLDDDKTLPSQWESELKIIRRRSQLNETRTLVIDSLRVKIGDLDKIINENQDKFTTTVLSTPVKMPKENNASDKSTNTKKDGSKKKPRNENFGSKKKQFKKNEVSSARTEETIDDMDEPAIQIRSINANISEFVITDDEDEKDPLKVETATSDSEDTISVNSVEGPESPLVTSNDPHTRAMVTSNAPKLVPIEKLLEQPNIESNSEPKFILHPIILNETGSLTVPTLTAQILDGHLVPNNIIISPINNNQVLQNGQLQQIYSSVLPVSQTEINPQKRKCVDMATQSNVNDVDMANQSKRKVLPDDAKPSENKTIDWEDKIPMDVISFVDAVDPNFVQMPQYSMTSNIGATSNNTNGSTFKTTRHQDTSNCEVIDLC